MKDEAENEQIEKEEKAFREEEVQVTPRKMIKLEDSQPT